MADCAGAVSTEQISKEGVIPASPNWYCSTATSCNNNGLLAFAARNQIFIFHIANRHPKFKDSFQFFKERLTSVCWLKENPVCLAFGGEEGIVRIFNTNERKILAESKKQNSKISAMVAAEGGTVLSGDEKGLLVFWDYGASNVSTWLPVPASICSMSIAPANDTLLAVGYGNGHVLVCDFKKQNIIQHYKSHLDEVHSVTWQPFSNDINYVGKDNDDADGLLVASGSKDKTIRIWNINKENPFLTLNIPAKSSSHKGRRKVDEMNRSKLWITLCWCKKDALISSSNSGELLIWDLKTNNSKCIAPAHNRIVFNISHDSAAKKIATTSMDRQIMFWDADTYELLTSMPSLGGYVYSAAASYLDPYKIVYGVGDNLIRVWNTRANDKPFETNLIWQGIKSKVTVVECHPVKESVVGFGTDDGHVGIYNVSSGKFEVSVSYHRKTVYSLSWGPRCDDEDDNCSMEGNWLYSCGGEGTILIHAMSHLQNKARDMNAIIKKTNAIQEKLPSRSDVEWKRDLKFVAIGNDDGSVEIYSSPKLRKTCTIYVHRKIINCIKWHHHFENLQDVTGNTFSNWLATGSSDNYICVSDLSSVLERSFQDQDPVIIKDKFRHFNMHSQRITRLSWSPHSIELLASSSYDGSVQIWNVLKNEPIANYRGHNGRVLCVVWSLVDPDIIYSGSEDFTLRRWAISACKHKLPSEIKKPASQTSNSETKKKSKVSTTKEGVQLREEKEMNERKLEKGNERTPMQSLSDLKSAELLNSDFTDSQAINESLAIEKPISKIEPTVKRAANKGESKKKKTKSLLPLSSSQNHKQKAASQKECVLLAKYLQDKANISDNDEFQPGTNEFVNLGLFADRISTFKMFSSEGKNHSISGNVEQQLHLELWKGNLGGALKTCNEIGDLNEMIVAMSPLGGYDLWQATMQAYGDQLASKGDFVTAATYYVAINKVKEAIEMFKAQNMFKEAISLAKVRLPSDDVLLMELYQQWGDRQSAEACYENAAKCYIASGDHKSAIKILARKGDVSSLKTAAQVALIYNEIETANVYLKQSAEIELNDLNWKEVKETTNMMQQSEAMVLQCIIHELLARCFIGTEIGDALNLGFNAEKNSCYITNNNVMAEEIDKEAILHAMNQTRFLQVIESAFNEQFGHTPSSNVFENRELFSRKNSKNVIIVLSDANLKNVLFTVSSEITTGIIKLLERDMTNCYQHWLSAADTLYRSYQLEALEILYKLLFPRGFTTFEEMIATSSLQDTNKTFESFDNFHAYYKTSVLFQFWWRRFPYIMLIKSDQIKSEKTGNLEDFGESNLILSRNWVTVVASEFRKVEASNILTFVASVATTLLSSSHCRLSQLKYFVKDIEQSILELKIKKQLREHILSKQEEDKKKKQIKSKKNVQKVSEGKGGMKLSACDDDNWRERTTNEIKCKEDKMKEGNESREDAEISNNVENEVNVNNADCLMGQEIAVVDDSSLQLMQKQYNETKNELGDLETTVNFECFPNCLENAKILLHIILCFVKNGFPKEEKVVKKLLILADDIIKWGLGCCLLVGEKRIFEQFATRFQTVENNIL